MGPVSGSFASLECFVGDPLINLTVMTLILVAGLGFPVWQDLAQNRLCWKKLRLHTRAVLALTAFLVLVPAALFFIALGLLCGSLFTVKQVGGICGALLTNLSAWLSGAWFDLTLVGGAF